MPALDHATLLFATSLILVIATLGAYILTESAQRFAGAGHWAFGNLLLTASFVLFARERLGYPALTVVGATAFSVAAACIMARGVHRFYEAPAPVRLYAFIWLAAVFLAFHYTFIAPDPGRLMIGSSIAYGLVTAGACRIIAVRTRLTSRIEMAAFAFFALLALGHFGRALLIHLVGRGLVALPLSRIQDASVVALMAAAPIWTVFFGLLTADRYAMALKTVTERLDAEVAVRRRIVNRLEGETTQDPLTQVGNRRKLYEDGTRLFAAAKRHGRVFSAIIFDVDNFKRVNDKYGHRAGDTVLQELAEASRNVARIEDTVGRYGGEEFLILLPDTVAGAAEIMAERLRITISRLPIQVQGSTAPLSVTCSFGVSQFVLSDTSVQDVISRADDALYKAKASGKNRVARHEAAAPEGG